MEYINFIPSDNPNLFYLSSTGCGYIFKDNKNEIIKFKNIKYTTYYEFFSILLNIPLETFLNTKNDVNVLKNIFYKI
jgi:hypothetical protein